MLYLVLVLVVAAFGLLVAALTTQAMLWAWVSVGVSIIAGVVLVVDSVRRRRFAVAAVTAEDEDEPPAAPAEEHALAADPEPATPAGSGSGPAEAEPDEALGDAEPAEEDTDAADVLVVSELTAEVVVVDERPRYHLTGCRWLRDRDTIPLPVKEARELGFTPCGVCTPDRKLAARHRRDGKVSTE